MAGPEGAADVGMFITVGMAGATVRVAVGVGVTVRVLVGDGITVDAGAAGIGGSTEAPPVAFHAYQKFVKTLPSDAYEMNWSSRVL